jgi:hypothetical protein
MQRSMLEGRKRWRPRAYPQMFARSQSKARTTSRTGIFPCCITL